MSKPPHGERVYWRRTDKPTRLHISKSNYPEEGLELYCGHFIPFADDVGILEIAFGAGAVALAREHKASACRFCHRQSLAGLRVEPGISRITSYAKSTHGWYARTYGANGANRMFSDAKCGGIKDAFLAAREWVRAQKGT